MERDDIFKMLVLIAIIIILIVSGLYLTTPTGYTIAECRNLRESYIVFEPYTKYESKIEWEDEYRKVLNESNVSIPRDKPAYISYKLCSSCKYNITFISDKNTSFFIFNQYNKKRYFDGKSNFPLMKDFDNYNKTFNFTSPAGGEHYFVFDRSSHGTKKRSEEATGSLLIYELKRLNITTERTAYREITKYRNVTRCD